MASKNKKPLKLYGSRSGGNRSLGDLNRRSCPDSDSDSDGPQVQDTGGKKSHMIVGGILNQARPLRATNNDPLRRMNDPENASFSEEPKRSTVVFEGAGRTLGGNTTPASSEPIRSMLPPRPDGHVLDETKPTTSIQLRLADGKRMIAHFNYHHTIKDIRGFIDSSRSGGSKTYHLQAIGFPPKPLADLNETIEHAGLANSVVVQKL